MTLLTTMGALYTWPTTREGGEKGKQLAVGSMHDAPAGASVSHTEGQHSARY